MLIKFASSGQFGTIYILLLKTTTGEQIFFISLRYNIAALRVARLSCINLRCQLFYVYRTTVIGFVLMLKP